MPETPSPGAWGQPELPFHVLYKGPGSRGQTWSVIGVAAYVRANTGNDWAVPGLRTGLAVSLSSRLQTITLVRRNYTG